MKNLVLTIALFSSVFAFSQQKEDWNLRGERKRTAQGIQSGEINKKEAAVIHKQARDVKQAKRNALAAVSYTHLDVYKRQTYRLDSSLEGSFQMWNRYFDWDVGALYSQNKQRQVTFGNLNTINTCLLYTSRCV